MINQAVKISDSKTTEWIVHILRRDVDQIVSEWSERIHRQIPSYQNRPMPELLKTVSEHLDGIVDFFSSGHDDKLFSFMNKIASMRASQNFPLADIQKAFLTGKDVIYRHLLKNLPSGAPDVLSIFNALEEPFNKTIYEYAALYQQLMLEQAKEQERKLILMQEKQRYLQEITHEKEKLELIIEAVGIDVALLNKSMEIEWSYSYLKGGKLRRNDRVGHSCAVLDWHEAGGCENCPAKRSFITKKIESGIAERTGPEGDKRSFQIVSKPLVDENGQVTHVLEFVHEITDLCNLERRLAEQYKINSAIVNGSSHAFIGLDPEGKITSWNPAAEKIFGHPAYKVLGRPAAEILPELMSKIESQPPDSIEKEVEISCRQKDGCTLLVEVKSSKIYAQDGTEIGTSLIVSDITEKHKLEEKVLQAERMAMVGQMASKVAHEIRNPLSSISLNSELLLDELETFKNADTQEARELLLSIASEIDRLVNLTEEYLNFSRLPRPKLQPVDVNDLVNELALFFSEELAQKHIRISTSLNRDLPSIHIDKAQLRRALINLIRNSKEAIPATGGDIILSTEWVDSKVVITVKDTGEGISEQAMKSIFNPFFSTKSFGTGLGLPLARQIIEDHGGQIACQSKVGQGTIFTIMLPVVQNDEGAK